MVINPAAGWGLPPAGKSGPLSGWVGTQCACGKVGQPGDGGQALEARVTKARMKALLNRGTISRFEGMEGSMSRG